SSAEAARYLRFLPHTSQFRDAGLSRGRGRAGAGRTGPLGSVDVVGARALVVPDLVLDVDETDAANLEAELLERLLETLDVDVDPGDVVLDHAHAGRLLAELVDAELLQQIAVRVVVGLPVDDLGPDVQDPARHHERSEEHTSELQSR